MKIPAWIGVLAFISFQSLPAQAQTPLPVVQLRLQCFDDSARQTAAEIEGVRALHAFALEHDAETVWLDAVIEADAGAGACSRDASTFPEQPAPTGDRARIVFQPCAAGGADSCGAGNEDMVRVSANGPPLAFTHGVLLPLESSLDARLPYRYGRYGDWLNYQGPFIVRYFEGTGYAFVTFHQPHPALPGVWERARCNTRPETCLP